MGAEYRVFFWLAATEQANEGACTTLEIWDDAMRLARLTVDDAPVAPRFVDRTPRASILYDDVRYDVIRRCGHPDERKNWRGLVMTAEMTVLLMRIVWSQCYMTLDEAVPAIEITWRGSGLFFEMDFRRERERAR